MGDESTHYCQEHQTTYNAVNGKYGVFYSHPLEGGGFCKEAKKKDQVDKPPMQAYAKKVEPYQQFKADPEKQASIELQHYTDNVKDLWIAGKLQNDSPLVKKYLSILYSKVGATVDLPKAKPDALQSTTAPPSEKSSTKTQPDGVPAVKKVDAFKLAALNELAKKQDNFDKMKLEIKSRGWPVSKLKELSQPQAEIILGLFDETVPEDDIPF